MADGSRVDTPQEVIDCLSDQGTPELGAKLMKAEGREVAQGLVHPAHDGHGYLVDEVLAPFGRNRLEHTASFQLAQDDGRLRRGVFDPEGAPGPEGTVAEVDDRLDHVEAGG